MTDENRHFRVIQVNSELQVTAMSGRFICTCTDRSDAAKICELLEADAQAKEKKQ